MPTITVDGRRADVAHGRKLALAIEELGIDIGHRCGGKARCTTCRVAVDEGESATYTRAEYHKLTDAGLLGEVRLACQLVVEGDMRVRVLRTKQTEGWADTGPALTEDVIPDAERRARSVWEDAAASG